MWFVMSGRAALCRGLSRFAGAAGEISQGDGIGACSVKSAALAYERERGISRGREPREKRGNVAY